MKFKRGSRRQPIEYEKDLLSYWKKNRTFQKSVEQRPATNAYVFYDGPPFITGVPHLGTLLSSVVKDAVGRYWTMQGKRVERVWGWDCHGLPAEVFTEQKLGIHDKRDIGTKVSLEDYINTCRNNMVQTGSEWEDIIERVGRWVDFSGAYKTMDKNYMESVWWAFKQLYENGKIYEGEKVLLYCVRDATPVSKAEVAMDNSYQEVTDPSVYVKFQLTPESYASMLGNIKRGSIDPSPTTKDDVYLLAWTTTPWTLLANTALGIDSKGKYAEIELQDGQRFIMLQERLSNVLLDDKNQPLKYAIKRTFDGTQLAGLRYKPLFENRGHNAHKVWNYPGLKATEGTGVVHLAPAYGEEDYWLAKKEGFPVIQNVDDNGFYSEGEWTGKYVWDFNKEIAKSLHQREVVWRIDYVRHSYPHCHRCGTRLMYRAHPSWFMDIASQRQQMLEENSDISWFPEHLKLGRFAKTVETAPDWNISRDRFWATAMPVWKGKDAAGKEQIKVIGSYAELKELSGVELEDYHRPWIDKVTFKLNGIKYSRIDKVLDCWFESGSMPFAQFHYPFEQSDKFEQNFPGDFIAEYIGQVRAWFYSLHAVSVGLFNKKAFNNVVVTGTLSGNDGRKMSKSFGNFTDPSELMDKFSADSLRFLFLSSPLLNAEDFSLQDKEVADVARKLNMIWNMYDFFTLYADVDNWQWDGHLIDPAPNLSNPLDQWIVSRLHQLTHDVESHMLRYDLPNALKPVLPFIDDASNWYVRRSRKRFWKSDNDADKSDAYRTLHYVLVQLSIILAPFTPFLSEELFMQLTGGESVHLLNWPKTGHINELILEDMRIVRDVISEGLAQRAEDGIKVRQPLASVNIYSPKNRLTNEFKEIIAEELNVKKIETRDRSDFSPIPLKLEERLKETGEYPIAVLNLEITPELKREGLMREVVRHIQQARKQAGLKVDDRIELKLSTKDETLLAVFEDKRLTSIIKHETLAISFSKNLIDSFDSTVSIDGAELEISITKTSD